MACTLTGCICQASAARASAARDPRPAHARPHDAAFPKAPLADPRSPHRIASEWFACEKLIGDADFKGIACIPEAVESPRESSDDLQIPGAIGPAQNRPQMFCEIITFLSRQTRFCGCFSVCDSPQVLRIQQKANWRKRVRVERTDDIGDAVRRF
jgi:hypothetical protein